MIPILGIAGPILILPVVTGRFGAAAWVAVAIGQSIGAALGTIAELGWALNGPQRVARMSADHMYRATLLSLQTKVLAFPVLAAAAMITSYLIAPEFKRESALVAVSTLTIAFSFSWVFLGKSRPWLIVALDSLPRTLALMGTAMMLYLGGPLWTYPVFGLLLPAVLSPLMSLAKIRSWSSLQSAPFAPKRQVVWSMRAQGHAVSARLASAAYIALPITLVGIVAPSAVALFAAGERLMRLSLTAIVSAPNAMQAWVGVVPHRKAKVERARRAIVVNSVLGVIAATMFGLFAPWASLILFSGVATLSSGLAWLFSIVILVVCTSRATGGIGLVAIARIRVLALSAFAGAAIGLPAILILGRLYGSAGGVLGEILAEVTVLGVQLWGFIRGTANTQ